MALVLGVVTLFGVVLFQMLGTLNLYAASRVEASLFGIEFPVVWILSMNPVVMLLIMPPLARRWRAGLFFGALGLGGFLSGQIGASAEALSFGAVFTMIACACVGFGAGLLAARRSAARIGL